MDASNAGTLYINQKGMIQQMVENQVSVFELFDIFYICHISLIEYYSNKTIDKYVENLNAC